MIKYLLAGIVLVGLTVICQSAEPERIVYPVARQSDHVDQYFGTKVADPYRWMEENDTPELKQWIEAENKITSSVLSGIPFRDRIRREITERINYPKHSLPFKKNGRYFFFHNTGLQNQSVLYHTDSLDSKAKVLLDPNTLSQ
ncbi:MAG: S9 family peptidase, partial [Thermoguttaceae bacterium]|nr:S9 family peptidase [Thermoguttaceae bacterium]